MTEQAKRRIPWKAILLGLWILEWVLGWSASLGRLGHVIGVTWWIGLAYFALDTRLGKTPPRLHTWAWMAAPLLIAVLRSWQVGSHGPDVLEDLFRQAITQMPGLAGEVDGQVTEIIGALVTSAFVGLLLGIVATMELAVIGAMGWVGHGLRERPRPPRVGLLPRLTVLVLQAPTVLALALVGFSVVAGVVGTWAHPKAPGAPGVLELPGFDTQRLIVLAVGLGSWALAVLHARRLEALEHGAPLTRVLLAALAVVGPAGWIWLEDADMGTTLIALGWLVVQLAAIRWARPTEPARVTAGRSKPVVGGRP